MKYIVAEYVWVDGSGVQTRSKTRTVRRQDGDTVSLQTFAEWNYDGSSCGQATTKESEVTLVPVAFCDDPFRRADAYLVLCKTKSAYSDEPTAKGSQRHLAEAIFEQQSVADEQCWFGLEQEYVVYSFDTRRPLGWPSEPDAFPAPQGPYYCAPSASGRAIAEQHYYACLDAGIEISGYNMEVLLGQLEFQIGPCLGIAAGDQMTLARYILDRVCEQHNCYASLHPKPLKGDWNGSGMHTNFSTKTMRDSHNRPAAWSALNNAVEKLQAKHREHMLIYGEHNDERMSGLHETSSFERCTHGLGDRSASIRIGKHIERQRYGYIEDRRPASNANPYLVTAKIAETVCAAQQYKQTE